MGEKRVKLIRLPCDLKAKVKCLARLNGITTSDLVRYSIEAGLPECDLSGDVSGEALAKTEAGRSPTEIPMRDDLTGQK